MSSMWFETSSADPERSWELYHENSKRGRRLGVAGTGSTGGRSEAVAPAGEAYGPYRIVAADGLSVSLAEAAIPIGPPARGAVTTSSLSAVLAAAGRSMGNPDPTHLVLHIGAVDALPKGLYRYRPDPRALQSIGREDAGRRLLAATAADDASAPPPLMVFIVGRLDEAAMTAGERGYRKALMAAGRHAHAIGLAAEAAGLWCQDVAGFYDREVDALLSLDGLSRSTLCVMALGTVGHEGGRPL